MSRALRIRLLVAFAVVSGLLLLRAVPTEISAAGQNLPSFGRPTVLVNGNGFELGGRLNPAGDLIYAHAPAALSSTVGFLWKSDDGGASFKWVAGSAPLEGKLPTCVGGGDTEAVIDESGRIYFNELTLANLSSSRSDDGGRTWLTQCLSVETTPDDRQWYAIDGDAVQGGNIYLTYNIVGGDAEILCPAAFGDTLSVGNNQLVLARSPLPALPGTGGLQFAPSKFVSGGCDEAIMGNVEVSPATHRIFIIHDDATLESIRIGRCQTVPFTVDPTGLACVDREVAAFPGFITGANFPSLAIDSAGNLYAVWQQAAINEAREVIGDTRLYWSSSRDEGETWSPPVQVPTPGLRNNVFTWMAAGDPGRVGIAWYGTPAAATGTCGPDCTNGDWGVYYAMTENGLDAVPKFTAPILASEQFAHRGTMFTLIGNQAGNREVGDFMQMRIGPQGEAILFYADTRNQVQLAKPMVVRQTGGPRLFAGPPLKGPGPATNSVADRAGDATYEAAGLIGDSQPNLDILGTSVAMANPSTLRVTMTVADLTNLAPDPTTGNTDPVLLWQVQWLAPSQTDPFGGKNFFVYMESINGGPPAFFSGENAQSKPRAGRYITYPGAKPVPGFFTPGKPGTITINVPLADVAVADPLDTTLYSVTAATMTLPAPASSVPPVAGNGGVLFNLIDAAPPFDFVPPRN